jgi:cell wall-associated NlpC family hydrolase
MNKKTVAIGAIIGSLGIVIGNPASAEASSAGTAISFGKQQLGDIYSQANPQGPNHWDCSGLVRASYAKAGKSLPRVAQDQYNSSKVKSVAAKNRKPGDLVFFGSSSRNIRHVGIYVGWKYKNKGGGWLLNANSGEYRGRKVVIAPIKEYGRPIGYKRVK